MTAADPDSPFILTVAPNGARKSKDDHPALPIEPDEIARTAAACAEAGAAMIHLHVRDREGRHTLSPEAYRPALDAVRRAVGDRMIVQVTTEAVGRYLPGEQMAVVRELRPEAVSLAVREIVPDAEAEPEAARFLHWLDAERIQPQYILYSEDDLRRFADLRARGIVPARGAFLLLVLGRYTSGQVSHPRELLPFIPLIDARDAWAVCAFGPREGACALTAAALGGHSRVGFENNTRLNDGRRAPDNAALVAQASAGARWVGRSVADAHQAREALASL